MNLELSHQLDIFLQARIPVICINTPIKERIITIKNIYDFSANKGLNLNLWNHGWEIFKNVECPNDKLNFSPIYDTLNSQTQDIFTAFSYLLNCSDSRCFILENIFDSFQENTPFLFQTKIVSQITNVYYELCQKQSLNKILILLTNEVSKMPHSLQELVPIISTPLPEVSEIPGIIQDFLKIQLNKDDISSLGTAASGLNSEEIRSGCALACASLKWEQPLNKQNKLFEYSPTNIRLLTDYLQNYKAERFQSMGLDLISQDGLSEFGGFDLLKKFIDNVKCDFSPKARHANIPLPKGCLLVGPPGTGKTLSARVSAKILDFPLVSVDTSNVAAIGAIYLKQLIQRVEACAPCLLYFDEFDKLFDADHHSGDDKKSKSILGFLLTWLQDKRSPVFVMATLNRLEALPPELTRVGRFDEIFWVGFPQANERKEILTLHLSKFDPRYKHGDPLSEQEWRQILNKTINCTGAELARCVDKAARELFHQNQEIEIGAKELLEQREQIVPLFSRDTDRILAMENKAKHFSQPASSPDTSIFAPSLQSYWGNQLK